MITLKDFSVSKFLNDHQYARRYKKYLKRNIYLDTHALCLILLGKFDDNYDYNTLEGEKSDFMNIITYKKLINILDKHKNGKKVVTPAVITESLNHLFTAIENKYSSSPEKKEIENKFAHFLQQQIILFKEKNPSIKDMLTHRWTEMIKHHKLRDRFEAGELSIFVEIDKGKYSTIVTNDRFRIDKDGENYEPDNTLIININTLALS